MKTELEFLQELEADLTLWWRSSESEETFSLINDFRDKIKERIAELTNEEEG